MFSIKLTVSGTGKAPLRGFVYFLVHPSFPEDIYKVFVKNNVAVLQLDGYEAFTVGAVCDKGKTELELNLNTQAGIPQEFKYPISTSFSNESNANMPLPRSKSVLKRRKK